MLKEKKKNVGIFFNLITLENKNQKGRNEMASSQFVTRYNLEKDKQTVFICFKTNHFYRLCWKIDELDIYSCILFIDCVKFPFKWFILFLKSKLVLHLDLEMTTTRCVPQSPLT